MAHACGVRVHDAGPEATNTLFNAIQNVIMRALLAVQPVMINDKHSFEVRRTATLNMTVTVWKAGHLRGAVGCASCLLARAAAGRPPVTGVLHASSVAASNADDSSHECERHYANSASYESAKAHTRHPHGTGH